MRIGLGVVMCTARPAAAAAAADQNRPSKRTRAEQGALPASPCSRLTVDAGAKAERHSSAAAAAASHADAAVSECGACIVVGLGLCARVTVCALLDGTLLCCVECVCVFSVACVSVFVIATVRSVCCAHRLNPTGGAQGAPTDELRACVYVGLCPGSF